MTTPITRSEIEWLLVHWARWAYHRRGIGLDWPSIEPYERLAHERMGDTAPTPEIADRVAQAVDRAVAELIQARPAEGEALARYYLNRETYRSLARKLKRRHQIVAHQVDAGRMWVEGRLVDLLAAD